MMLDLKEKIGHLKKKFKCGIVPKCGVILKNLSEESRSLFLGAASRMFCTCDVKQLKSSSKSIFLKSY